MSSDTPVLACVVLAHQDPQQVQRLVAALDPFPVFLHCDSRTPSDVYAAMVEGLPARCVVMPRIRTGWARWENVAAELAGYRAAIETTRATHVALLSGTDYPVAGPTEIRAALAALGPRSAAQVHPLPNPEWGRSGGFDRLRFRHWAVGKRMLRLPIPRRLPEDVVLAGGSQMKLLSRHHVEALLQATDQEPELMRFWRRSWVADETFVPSILSTPRFVPDWKDAHVPDKPWLIGWAPGRQKSPMWLVSEFAEGLETYRSKAAATGLPALFARKFSTDRSSGLLDAIDARIADDELQASTIAEPSG